MSQLFPYVGLYIPNIGTWVPLDSQIWDWFYFFYSDPLDQNQCLVLHLKDLFHICLETKIYGFWMTFKVCNDGSKCPYLLHKMGFVDSQFGTTVPIHRDSYSARF